MMRTLRKTLIAGLAGLGLLSALMGGGMMGMRAAAADGGGSGRAARGAL